MKKKCSFSHDQILKKKLFLEKMLPPPGEVKRHWSYMNKFST